MLCPTNTAADNTTHMLIDLIASLTVVCLIGGLLGLALYAAERKPTKPRGRKAVKLDCWL